MTNTDILKALLNKHPYGVSFDPMAVRLLRKTIPFEDWQIEELKDEMFQLGEGLWFSLDMIADDETRRALQEQVSVWLLESPCVSLGRLFESYCGVLLHISTLQDFATFLRKLGVSVSEYGRAGFYCFKPTSNLGESLTLIAKLISEWQEDAGGMLALYEIEERLPYLTVEALEDIRTKFLPEIHVEEVGGLPCWRNAEAVHLPEDFSEKITDAVDTLVVLGREVNTNNLEFALDLFYRIRFREAYNLTNRRVFMSICAKHYNGTPSGNRLFSREFLRDWAKHHGKLQVPHRAHADPVASINGAAGGDNFAPPAVPPSPVDLVETEVAVANEEQHSRERTENCWNAIDSKFISSSEIETDDEQRAFQAEDNDREIIGLEGRPLKLATWQAFKSAGTDPRVAEWDRRVQHGESVELIARETGYATTTMRNMISNFNLYYKVCELNKIVPEVRADV